MASVWNRQIATRLVHISCAPYGAKFFTHCDTNYFHIDNIAVDQFLVLGPEFTQQQFAFANTEYGNGVGEVPIEEKNQNDKLHSGGPIRGAHDRL